MNPDLHLEGTLHVKVTTDVTRQCHRHCHIQELYSVTYLILLLS